MFGLRCLLRRLVTRVLGGLQASFGLLNLAAGAFLGFPAGIVLGLAAGFLGGGEDRDLFLLTAFRVAAG